MNRLTLALVLVVLLSWFSFADVQVSSISVSPATLRPGNTGSVSFTLTNTGASAISGLTLYPTGSKFDSLADKVSVGNIGASGSTQVSIQFRISPDADSGVYNLMVNSYWNDNTVGGGIGNKIIQVPVTVSKQTIFSISSSPQDVSIGGDFELDAQVKNTGGKATNVVMAIDSQYFVATESSGLLLGDIPAGATANVKVPISTSPTMPSGVYSVPVTITYQDDLGSIQQATATLGTVQAVKGFVDFSVIPTLDEASPGKTIRMVLSVRNDGTLLAHTLRCSVSSSSAFFLPVGSSQKLVGDIKAGETASVSYDLSISSVATPGVYPVILSFDYLNKQGEPQTTITKTIGVEVVGVPKLAVITSTTPSPVTANGRYSLSVQVSNVGTTDVKSLTAEIGGDSFTVLDNSNSIFIGTLKMDDYSQASFNVLVNKNVQPGKYPITVKMKFMDAYNTEQELDQTAYLQVVSPEIAAETTASQGGGLGTAGIVIVLLVVVVLAYLAYRKFFKKSNGKK